MGGLTPFVATRRLPSRSDEFRVACGDHYFTARAWDEGVLALAWESDAPLPVSPAVVQSPGEGLDLSIRELPQGWRMAMPGLQLRVSAEPLTLHVGSPSGEQAWGPVHAGLDGNLLTLWGPLAPSDAFFGLGEKPGYLNRRGRAYTMWNTDNTGPHVETDDVMYQSIPFLLTWHEGRVFGWLFDDPGRTRFDLGAADVGAWRYDADGPGQRLYVIAGPTLAEVLARYGRLTGRMPLPPRWALGYHQSRWSYESADEVEQVAQELRDRAIPADVIHLDIAYMDAYRVFTWSPARFPDPLGLATRLASRGFRLVAIVDPGVKMETGYPAYEGCLDRGLHVRRPDGTPFVGEVWPGDCVFPDFSRAETRVWWGAEQAALLDAGVAGVWNDMNEPSVFRGPAVPRIDQTMPDDAQHGSPTDPLPHRQVHNLYGFGMSQASWEGCLARRPNERPFVISRAGYAGIQRYATVWTGDNHSIWAHLDQGLAMCLGLGLSGVPFVGPDVGGFSGDCEGELLVRWTQAGVFTPFFRNHSALGTRRQEPWTFGSEVEAHCREAIALRYRLLPYVYTAFQEASTSALPIMRPLLLTHPELPESLHLTDQFFFGADLLVAPITRPGARARMVVFPPGDFVDFHTGETLAGGSARVVGAPLGRVPVYVRAGAIIPMGPRVESTDVEVEELTLRVFPGDVLTGGWYDDDGHSLAFEQGAFNMWRLAGGWQGDELRLTVAREAEGYASPTRRLSLQVPLAQAPARVSFAGEAIAGWHFAEGILSVAWPWLAGEFVIEGAKRP